jgi:hypothetical protein
MLGYANFPEKLIARDIIGLVSWVKGEYEVQLARLGYADPQPALLETLEPLYHTYFEHIKVNSRRNISNRSLRI